MPFVIDNLLESLDVKQVTIGNKALGVDVEFVLASEWHVVVRRQDELPVRCPRRAQARATDDRHVVDGLINSRRYDRCACHKRVKVLIELTASIRVADCAENLRVGTPDIIEFGHLAVHERTTESEQQVLSSCKPRIELKPTDALSCVEGGRCLLRVD